MNSYWLPHVRVAFGGTFGTPALETWSNTVRLLEDVGYLPTVAELQVCADTAWTSVSNWFTGGDSKIGGGTRLTWLKLNVVNANGKQRDTNTIQHLDGNGPLVGGSAVPWYQTWALTHRTAVSRGRGHSGRIYPPATRATVENSTPYCALVDADLMATAWASCLGSLATVMNDHAYGGLLGGLVGTKHWAPVVMSPGDLDKPGEAATVKFNKITGVVCDRVPDVQHRRTKSVPRSEGGLKPVPAS